MKNSFLLLSQKKDNTARYIIVETEYIIFKAQWPICHFLSHVALQISEICLSLPLFNSNFVVVLPGCFEDLFLIYSCKLESEQSVFLSVIPLIEIDWNTHVETFWSTYLDHFFTSEIVNNDSEYLFAFPLRDSYNLLGLKLHILFFR